MSYSEMLPSDIFERREWQGQIAIKHLLTNDEDISSDEIVTKGKQIAAILSRCHLFDNAEVIEGFEHVDNLDAFNDLLDEMYDECDSSRILVK